MKASFQARQQHFSRLPQDLPVRPPAMAAKSVLGRAPDALHRIQFRAIGRQETGPDLAGPRVAQLIQKGDERRAILAEAQLPVHLSRGIVQGTQDDELAVGAGQLFAYRVSRI